MNLKLSNTLFDQVVVLLLFSGEIETASPAHSLIVDRGQNHERDTLFFIRPINLDDVRS